jgi:hypothetical protein
MSPLLEIFIEKGLLLDTFGILGLGLVGLAALKLARSHRSWGGTMMALGAIALISARLYFLLSRHFVTDSFLDAVGPLGYAVIYSLPPILLTFGLAGVVWGLWGHERWLHEERR